MFSDKFQGKFATHYQGHLERISDFLRTGPGIWWKKTDRGVEFLDGSNENDTRQKGPTLMHFRSTSMAEIDLHLVQAWEECLTNKVQLPAKAIRYYNSTGDLNSIHEVS